MSTNIYILKLEGGNFYVGKSDNPMKRYQEHLDGSGSAWTKKYKPIGVEKIIEKASPFDEDRYVKEYMAKHGMDKVRGGAYVEMKLDEAQEYALKREIRGVKDLCTSCGKEGHWAKDCYANKNNKVAIKETQNKKDNSCYRCGRPGHYASNCYANTDKNGYDLDSDDSDEYDSEDSDDFDDSDDSEDHNESEEYYDSD